MDSNEVNEKLVYKDLSYKIIGIAMRGHKALGYGFLEKVYENAMMVLFRKEGIEAEQQKPINVMFENKLVDRYFADILVDDKVILELKTVDKLTDIHKAQTLNYLKATGKHLTILFNFHSERLQHKRIIL
ncbi:MAG TPA: GxxExxY protein [Candidatus Cloacimonetes bacterium]|nr:GxxExxY protein [Candidatus Cloacimonadota bacterium]